MLIYWAIFAFFVGGSLSEMMKKPDFHKSRPGWIVGGVLIVLMVGLRYEVGADWETYKLMFSYAGRATFEQVLRSGDPSFQVLNWLIQKLDAEIVWVNLVCAVIFTWGLFRLARTQPDPWLAVLIAIPYMVIVASNYTRQAAALGLIMAGLASLSKGRSLGQFVAYVALAATFHRTAIAIMPLVVFSRPRNRFLNVVGGVATLYAFYDFFLADAVGQLVKNYITTEQSSQGAVIRVAMSVLAASVFLFFRKELAFPPHVDRLWFYFSMACFAALLALVVTPSSTVVDRLSLYLMPLQIVILSRVPFIYLSRVFATLLIITYCFAIQFVWLNFATHAKYWLPFQFYPLFS